LARSGKHHLLDLPYRTARVLAFMQSTAAFAQINAEKAAAAARARKDF
jgi:hypothetical protein